MNNATEKDYEDLERLSAKLHLAVPTAKWGFKLEAPDGSIVLDTMERAHSWVRNTYNFLTSSFCFVNISNVNSYGEGYLNPKTISGTIKYSSSGSLAPSSGGDCESPTYNAVGLIGAAGSNVKGIVLGTGVTPYSFDDYKLAAIIANGTAVGQLSYVQGTVSKSWDSVNKKYISVFSRVFNNNSSGDIVVSEGGIIGYLVGPGGSGDAFLVCRDVYDTPYTIPAAYKFTVSYTMSVQFPTV